MLNAWIMWFRQVSCFCWVSHLLRAIAIIFAREHAVRKRRCSWLFPLMKLHLITRVQFGVENQILRHFNSWDINKERLTAEKLFSRADSFHTFFNYMASFRVSGNAINSGSADERSAVLRYLDSQDWALRLWTETYLVCDLRSTGRLRPRTR